MSASLGAQDQTYVTIDGQKNLAEISAGPLATRSSGDLADSELGRWFATQHTFLEGGLVTAANATGASVPQMTDPTDLATGQMLATLSGAAFDAAYLPAEICGHTQNFQEHQTEDASGTNPTLVQLSNAEIGIIQNHFYEAQLLDQEQFGGAVPTVSLMTSFNPPRRSPRRAR